MENPNTIIEIETQLSPNEKQMLENFLQYVIDVGDVEIHDAKSYAMNSEFADKVYVEVNTINHQDIIANARD